MGVRLYTILGGIIAVMFLLTAAYFYGRHDGRIACENAHYKAAAQAAEKRAQDIKRVQDTDLAKARSDQQRETVARETYREVIKYVDRPVYRTACIDHDGLLALGNAISAANGRAATGGSNDSAPGTSPTAH